MAHARPFAVITNRLSTRYAGGAPSVVDHMPADIDLLRCDLEDMADLPAMIRECAAREVGTLVVDGGDGTVDMVFGSLLDGQAFETPPALALLPSGKTNMTAAAWSWKGRAEDGLDRLVNLYRRKELQNRERRRHILTVEKAGKPPLRGAFFGAADVVAGILYCRESIYPMGLPNVISHPMAISAILGRALKRGGSRRTIQVSVDGEEPRYVPDCFCMMITTLEPLLLGLRLSPTPSPLAALEMKAGVASVAGALRSAATSWQLASSAMSNSRRVQAGKEVKLAFDGPFTLDGELFEARMKGPLTIHARDSLSIIDLRRRK